jgi:DNA polymerase I-like protein with 3'-5' exonuclease and polymerase domains
MTSKEDGWRAKHPPLQNIYKRLDSRIRLKDVILTPKKNGISNLKYYKQINVSPHI